MGKGVKPLQRRSNSPFELLDVAAEAELRLDVVEEERGLADVAGRGAWRRAEAEAEVDHAIVADVAAVARRVLVLLAVVARGLSAGDLVLALRARDASLRAGVLARHVRRVAAGLAGGVGHIEKGERYLG